MDASSIAGARSGEWSRLSRLGVVLVDIYALIAAAIIFSQSSGASPPSAPLVSAQASLGAAYEIGMAAGRRHRGDAQITPTAHGLTFIARQACPGSLRGEARDAWIAEYKSGYHSALTSSSQAVALVRGVQVAVEHSNR